MLMFSRKSLGSSLEKRMWEVSPTEKVRTSLFFSPPKPNLLLTWLCWTPAPSAGHPCIIYKPSAQIKSVSPLITDIEIERFTFGFTIRDSAEFFINVSAWGGEAFISGLADSFGIGDCGEDDRLAPLPGSSVKYMQHRNIRNKKGWLQIFSVESLMMGCFYKQGFVILFLQNMENLFNFLFYV